MTDAPVHPDLTAEFDAFYRDTRDRLLLQAFALTGDLGAARSGVRDAFVLTWHHWRKISRLDDPEATVRSTAWRNALRRASARRWRREESADPEFDSTLAALADLTLLQRKALLLTQLAGTSLEEMAREIALPLDSAERELAAGAAVFSLARGVDNAEIPATLAGLAPATQGVRWPRVTIIKRAGAARRRAHTALGAAVAVAALVVAGVVVTDPTGLHPTLHRAEVAPTSGTVDEPQVALPDTALLPTAPVRRTLGPAWQQGRTDDNSEGTGRVLPCQRTRYADPHGSAAWVRVFRERSAARAGTPRRVVQTAEASASPKAASRAFFTVRQWLAACSPVAATSSQEPAPTQLIATYDVLGVGNLANLFLLRTHDTAATEVVGVARTGQLTTAVAMTTPEAPLQADRTAVADLLGAAVERLCDLPDSGRCRGDRIEVKPVPALSAGSVPTLLSEWDMPAVGRDTGAWSGTRPGQIRGSNGDVGVISCTTVSVAGQFRGAAFRRGAVRSLVLPEARLPVEFGLTQASASLPPARAAAWAQQVRQQIDDCPDSDAGAGTDVTGLARWDRGDQSLTAWRLETELPDDRAIDYSIAVVRNGDAVSVLLFVAVPRAQMDDTSFVALAQRAVERLGEMPAYRSDD